MLEGFKPIDNRCIQLMISLHKDLSYVDFFHSKIYSINDGMYYKVIDSSLYIIKPSAIMGTYSLILYTRPLSNTKANLDLNKIGVTIRSSKIEGTKDPFGAEYIYDTNEFIQMIGSKYRKHRNIINNFKTSIKIGNNSDISVIIKNWNNIKKGKHQIKLYSTIIKHLDLVHITTTYYKNKPIGFSIVERINDKFGIILQRLINPIKESFEVKEPNFLLHYNDCLSFPDYLLNMGSDMKIKNMQIAKEKLQPIGMQQIYRKQGECKITKEQYFLFKNNYKLQNKLL